MKVILISQDFYPLRGGISSYLMGLYKKYFSDLDFKVIIPDFIGPQKELNKLPFKFYKTKFFPFNMGGKRRCANIEMLKILKKEKPDILIFGYIRSHPEVAKLYSHFNPSVRWGIIIHAKEAFFNSCIMKITNRLGIYHLGYTKEEVQHYKKNLVDANFILATSKFSKSLLLKEGIKRKIEVITPVIDLDKVRYDSGAKKKLGLYGKYMILSVGRLIKRKGHEEVIRAMPNLLKEFKKIQYFIIGDGPEKKFLKSLVASMDLQEYVHIFDNINNEKLSIYYSACDLFILPCKFKKPNDIEGFGIVFIEAGAYGKPVIGGSTGGVIESIVNGKTGYLINPNSQKDIKNKISYLLRNPDLRRKLGNSGKLRAEKLFSIKESNKLVKILTKDIPQL